LRGRCGGATRPCRRPPDRSHGHDAVRQAMSRLSRQSQQSCTRKQAPPFLKKLPQRRRHNAKAVTTDEAHHQRRGREEKVAKISSSPSVPGEKVTVKNSRPVGLREASDKRKRKYLRALLPSSNGKPFPSLRAAALHRRSASIPSFSLSL
jgi:hypothetical protein